MAKRYKPGDVVLESGNKALVILFEPEGGYKGEGKYLIQHYVNGQPPVEDAPCAWAYPNELKPVS